MSRIASLLASYRSGEKTARAETEQYLDVITQKEPEIQAFLTVNTAGAVADAEKVDAKKDFSKPLAGIPGSIKDIICTEGIKTTAASKILENFVPPYDATVITKLKAAGFINLGKTNCDEFANGSSTEYSAFQQTKNPQDIDSVPGGSSGGSAAAVAAGECVFALGTDTGGSIRQPANFCGVVGLRPSYGRVSRYGAMAYASSFDAIGPFAQTVEDVARVMSVIAGKDENDSTTLDAPVPQYETLLQQDIRDKKVGIITEYMEAEGLDPRIKELTLNAAKKLEAKGAIIQEYSWKMVEYAIPTYYLLVKSEASTNFARYDGIRYGHLAKDAKTLSETYTKSRSEGFGPEIKRAIMMGTYTLSAGYYDAYYLKAAKVRTLIKEEYEKTFEDVDVVIAPVSPILPFKFGAKSDPLEMYLADLYTVTCNLAGGCGLAVPTEQIEQFRSGVQILGPQLGEEKVLNFGWHLEQSYRE